MGEVLEMLVQVRPGLYKDGVVLRLEVLAELW